jgi:hypothetical protein
MIRRAFLYMLAALGAGGVKGAAKAACETPELHIKCAEAEALAQQIERYITEQLANTPCSHDAPKLEVDGLLICETCLKSTPL